MANATTPPTSAPRIPHPPWRVPWLGDVLHFAVDEPAQSITRNAARLGPIHEFALLGARYLVASGSEVVADLNDENRFQKYTGDLEALRIIAGDGLFTAHGDEPNWRRAHELLMPAFTQAAMRRYHPVMLDVADELVRKWDTQATGDVTIDVSADTTAVTLETIGRCAAGYGFGALRRAEPHPFVEHMAAALKGAEHLTLLRFSSLPRFFGDWVERRIRAHGTHLHRVADDIVAARRAEGVGHHDDLLELMLAPGDDGRPALDETNIRYQLINFLVAGHETTSGTIAFALHLLSRHPEVVDRARAEVDDVWGPGDAPEFDRVTKLRYLRRVLDETLRLHPTVPAYSRAAREDTVLAGRYPMKRGDWALALLGTLHRDPRWGPDPDEFDPDRFLPERVKARPAGLYKPFGTGERACIGRQFALHEATLLLGTLIRRYDFVADPHYTLHVRERLTMMPKDLRLGLRRR